MKPNIQTAGKTFDYLKDPELRRKERGMAPLLVKGFEISGVQFHKLDWHNIQFVNCDFAGGYEIKLSTLERCVLEDCRFAGIIAWGVAKDVLFSRCRTAGESNIIDNSGSSNVRFEDCQFIGPNSDPNHWGAIGSRGDATFRNCKAEYFYLEGYAKLSLFNCDLTVVSPGTDSRANSGDRYLSSAVLIEKCKLNIRFDMRATDLASLTIRDTQIDYLDLTNATITGDVFLERVQGGFLNISINEGAQSFTLRDSRIKGHRDYEKLISVYAGAFKQVLVENVDFSDDRGRLAGIGGGYEIDVKTPQPVLTESIIFRKVKAWSLRASGLSTESLQITGCELTHAILKDSRIGRIEMSGNIISNSLNFTNTQAREQKIDLRAGGGLTGRADKLEGSNIRLQPR